MSSWLDYLTVPGQFIGQIPGMVGQRMKDDWAWGQKRSNVPQIPQNPYQSNWGNLIGQLTRQANGEGPSLAGEAYKQANAEGMRNQQALAAGGSAGGARQAGMNMGRLSQGLAQGYGTARLQEQMAARQALEAALIGAGNAWFQPQQANLQATLGTPTNGQMLLNFLSQLGQAGATIAGAGAK